MLSPVQPVANELTSEARIPIQNPSFARVRRKHQRIPPISSSNPPRPVIIPSAPKINRWGQGISDQGLRLHSQVIPYRHGKFPDGDFWGVWVAGLKVGRFSSERPAWRDSRRLLNPCRLLRSDLPGTPFPPKEAGLVVGSAVSTENPCRGQSPTRQRGISLARGRRTASRAHHNPLRTCKSIYARCRDPDRGSET